MDEIIFVLNITFFVLHAVHALQRTKINGLIFAPMFVTINQKSWIESVKERAQNTTNARKCVIYHENYLTVILLAKYSQYIGYSVVHRPTK